SAALNERPDRFWSYQSGRGYEPVMAVGSIMSCVTRSMRSSVAGFDEGCVTSACSVPAMLRRTPNICQARAFVGYNAAVRGHGAWRRRGLDGGTDSMLCFATRECQARWRRERGDGEWRMTAGCYRRRSVKTFPRSFSGGSTAGTATPTQTTTSS